MKKIILLLFMHIAYFLPAQNVGINNNNPQAALDLNGDLRLRSVALSLPSGYNHNVNLITSKSSVYKFAGDALGLGGALITGFTGGADGRIITLFNNSINGVIQLLDCQNSISINSTESNRILTGTGKSAVIFGSGSVTLRYDGEKMKWTILSSNFTEGLEASTGPWIINGIDIVNANGGNVGVGTFTNPTEKLDVSGNIKTTGEIKPNGASGQVNQILTSNGNGTMQWAAPQAGTGNVGFGSWGDCSTTNNISEYNPVSNSSNLENESLGRSVSISDNYAIIGAPGDNGRGSASIYQLSNGQWVFMQKLENVVESDDPSYGANDSFGISVCISGNYAIVGAPGDNQIGTASIFQLTGGVWVLMQKLTDAENPIAGDNCGRSVSISGNYAIIGRPYDDGGSRVLQGSATIFQRNGTSWTWMAKIRNTQNWPTANDNDYFGWSVSISGNIAVVGAPNADWPGKIDAGAVSIFNLVSGSWIQSSFGLRDDNFSDPYASYDNFGKSVFISGNTVIVGVPSDDVSGISNAGSAIVFELSPNGGYSQLDKLTNPKGTALDYFGSSVCVSSNYAIVGSPFDDVVNSVHQGSVSIFQRIGRFYKKLQYVVDPSASNGDYFGSAVGIDSTNKRFIIGANGFGAFNNGLAIFGKVN
jgi:hypothetical protein